MENSFCCLDFKWRYEADSGMGINIRVAELIIGDKNIDVNFFLTEGYNKDSSKVKYCKINFCPYCGKKLNEFYGGNKNLINSRVEDFMKF